MPTILLTRRRISKLCSSSSLSQHVSILCSCLFLCYFLAQHHLLCNSFQVNTIPTRTTIDILQQRKLSTSSSYYYDLKINVKQQSKSFLFSTLDPSSFFTDEEWHPNDPAYTTPQLLVGIWDQIAMAKTLTKGVSVNFSIFFFKNLAAYILLIVIIHCLILLLV
jgi:hypothetical protein